MKHKYGEFSDAQIAETKRRLRTKIFFLLRLIDPKTSVEYSEDNINVDKVFNDLLNKIGGLNSLLYEPPEIVEILSSLEQARICYCDKTFLDNFEHSDIRKLILDAGSEVLKIKEV